MTAKGLGEKAREWDSLNGGARLTTTIRAYIAATLNGALAEEGKGELVHVEHRSFADRGETGTKPTQHQGPAKTHAVRNRQDQARKAWYRQARTAQDAQHAKERLAMTTRHQFALAAIRGDFVEREKRGIAAIRSELAREQAADIAPKGLKRFFQVVSGAAMRADFARQARAAARIETAEQQITALKRGIRVEHSAYATAQLAEIKTMDERHRAADQHLSKAMSARVEFDRVAEQQMRREPVQEIRRERSQDRSQGVELSP